jgi:hypothetical protein
VDKHSYRVLLPDGSEYPFEKEGRRLIVGEVIDTPAGRVAVKEIVQQPEAGKLGVVRAERATGSRLG